MLVERALFVVAALQLYGVLGGHSLLFELLVYGQNGRRSVDLLWDAGVSADDWRGLSLLRAWLCVSRADSFIFLELLHPLAGNEKQITVLLVNW